MLKSSQIHYTKMHLTEFIFVGDIIYYITDQILQDETKWVCFELIAKKILQGRLIWSVPREQKTDS